MSATMIRPPQGGMVPAGAGGMRPFEGLMERRTVAPGQSAISAVVEAGEFRLNRPETQTDPRFLMRLAEAEEFVQAVGRGQVSRERLVEAMTNSDFPFLLGNNLYRKIIGYYQNFPSTYRNYFAQETVRDFRVNDRITLTGARGLLSPMAERTPPQERSYGESRWQAQVQPYSAAIDISWQMLVNDDLRAFRRIPQDLGFAAARTEEWAAASVMVDSAGPDATFFTNAHKNLVNTTVWAGASGVNPPLNERSLKDAYTILRRQLDEMGHPIMVTGVHLVTGPSLEVTAMDLVNPLQVWIMNEDRSASQNRGQNLVVDPWLNRRIKAWVNPYLEYINTTTGDTTWFLIADPVTSQRPAFEFDKLEGFESPALYRKKSDMEHIGGGNSDALMMSDFELGAIRHKVIAVFDSTTADFRYAVASKGTGS